MIKDITLRNEEIENFGMEIESLYLETKAKIGQEDLSHILQVKEFSTSLEVTGRSLIHLSKDPMTWMNGILLLGYHYLLEFTELGHNILHGQYDDIPGNSKVNSSTWKWDCTMNEEDWKYEHHVVHHPFTNILEKDNDFGFLLFRASDSQKWNPFHILQVPMLFSIPLINTFFFPWYVSTSRAIAENRDILSLETYLPSLKKIGEHLFKNYFLFPSLPGASYFKIAAGNFFAKYFQNFYLEMILAISHLHKDAHVFDNIENETKGEYYLRQVLSTINFDSPEPYNIIYGAINLHIEHHLFPDLPPNRLREVAPKVKAICEKYNIPYRSGPFLSQFMGVIENTFWRSLPIKPEDNGDIWKLITNPKELMNRFIEGSKNLTEQFSVNDKKIYFQSDIINVKEEIGGDAVSLIISIPREWKSSNWDSGSFISVQVIVHGKKYIRQYSLTHSSLTSEYLHITVKRTKEGIVSNFINDNLKKGDKITILGEPQGEFLLTDDNNKLLFIAAGAGITPIISMIRKLNKQKDLTYCKLLYFNRSKEKTLFLDEILELKKNGLDCRFYFESDFINSNPIIKNAEILEGQIIDKLDSKIYLCAPPRFIELTKSILKKIKFESQNLFLERFNAMNQEIDPKGAKIFHTIKFLKSKKEIRINENINLLDAIESSGISITSGCRQGLCKSCQVIKVSGKTQNELIESKNQIRISPCNTFPRSDMELAV